MSEEPTEQDCEEFIYTLLSANVAEELGWKYCKKDKIWRRNDEETEDHLPPPYAWDLNLCQEIEGDLREDEEIIFANMLTALINNGNLIEGIGFKPCPIIFASAATKCYAFAHVRNL